MKKQLHVLLFTDRPTVQTFFSGLKQLEGQALVTEVAPMRVESLVDYQQMNQADVVVVDIAPDPLATIQVCQEIHARYPALPILGLICCGRQISPIHVQKLTAAGVSSMLDSFATSEEILHALKRVAQGHIIVQLELSKFPNSPLTVNGHKQDSNTSVPTLFRDEDVPLLEAIARGASDREIAEQLHLSQPAVRHRLDQLYKATRTKNRTELAAWAGMYGFYRPSLR